MAASRMGDREGGGRLLRGVLAAILLLGTLAVFGATLGFPFVHLDDRRYVAENPWIAQGLSLQALRFAFSFGPEALWQGVSNWHPLTWLSYALDVELFGVDPGAFHGVNVALHAANALLCFALLDRTTRAPVASAAAAALFAWHPLHVEPVAWVSQRKELLAAAFGLLACHAYVGWTRRGGAVRYAGTAGLLALSLMSKPMWVTLPVLLLALDHWPLARLEGAFVRRVREKLPLLALSALSGAATLYAQRAALETGAQVPIAGRIANAIVAPVRYLAATLWPGGYSVLHPHPDLPGGTPLAAWQVAGSAALLVALAAVAARGSGRRSGRAEIHEAAPSRPYVAAGLAWFAIALLPVIGLVQVGEQAIADRYTYVPLIGVFLAVAFGARDAVAALARRSRVARPLALGAAAALLLACGWASADRAGAWRDTITLYQRSLETTPHSAVLHLNLGNRLLDVGREREAAAHYESARALRPAWPAPTLGLAWLLATSDDPALRAPQRALALAREGAGDDANANALDTLAAAQAAAGDTAGAAATAATAVRRAVHAGRSDLARAFESRRRLYAAGRAYSEPLRPGEVTSNSAVR